MGRRRARGQGRGDELPLTALRAAFGVRSDAHRHAAWIAVPGYDARVGVGAVRLARHDRDRGTAEMAIAVASDYRSAGLGTLLAETSVLSALHNGFTTVVGYVRPENVVAQRLMQRLGARPPYRENGVLWVEVPVGRGRVFRTSDARCEG